MNLIDYNDYEYIVYIDESGDSAYDKTLNSDGKGASNYLILGAAIIKVEDKDEIEESLAETCCKIKSKQIRHISDICHHGQKVYFYKMLNNINFSALGLVSYKSTLKAGVYKEYNPQNHQKFYHHNLFYLFEILNTIFRNKNIDKNKVLFIIEENNSLIKHAFVNYIKKIQTNNHKLTKINADNIYAISKNEDKLLLLADAIAHCLHHITSGQIINTIKITEPHYFLEIKNKFVNIDSHYVVSGIKFVHKIDDVNLSPEIMDMFAKI